MDSPINSDEQDIDEINRQVSSDHKYKKKFAIALAGFIAALAIIIAGSILLILNAAMKKEDSGSSSQTPTKQEDLKYEELPNNQVYSNCDCQQKENEITTVFSGNLWNTPPRGTSRWKEGFQDMNVLVGYPQLKYNKERNQCTVTVFTKTAIDLNLTYTFNGEEQKSNTKTFSSSFKDILKIKVKAQTGEVLELEDVDFIWNSQPLKTPKFDTKGQKGAIVEMYGWKDVDIEKECEFIGQQGYMGVKVFPHHEQVMSNTPFREQMNPWYFMYQPVSYSLNGRMGTRDEFRKMIKTCRANGVRVYADAVINHMTYNGMDLQNHRFTDEEDKYLIGEKYSTNNSPFWTPYKTYEKNPYTKRGTNALEYPKVPYGPMDFHCQKPITDYSNFDNVHFGWLDNLADLKTESEYVRQRIADYLTDLFSIGLTGFRLDAAKHIKPVDIAHILAKFKENIGGTLPEDFFTWLEILSGYEAEVLFGTDGENSYAGGMDTTLKDLGFTDDDILKVKIWWSSYPANYYVDKGTVDPRRKVIQNDDHDTQYADYRGLTDSGKGCVLTEDCAIDKHRNYEIALFEAPYDVVNNFVDAPIRMILSSFYTRYNGKRLEGLPDGLSDCSKSCKNDCDKCKERSLPEFPGYLANGKAYSGSGFTRVHRDEKIIAAMQKWMQMKEEWEELPNNQVYDNVNCQGNEKDIDSKFQNNLWNTPPRGSSRWKEGFQDMNVLVGYAQLKYSPGRQQCTVTVFTKTAQELDLTYIFDGEEQKSNMRVFDSTYNAILKIKVKAKSGETLELEDVDFVWNSQPLRKPKYDTKGKRGAIVEMYGWKDIDIEKECEFIGAQGYMGVKVFPHHEQLMMLTPFREQMNPWYFMYQPVSYSLNGRMGTRDDFRQMIKTCRANGVRVYADAVINHMTYNGMDRQNHRFTDEADQYLIGKKYSTNNSPFWTPYRTYEKNPYTQRGTNALEYPAVPYGPMDFHCQKPITDYSKFDTVIYGWLDNLADLKTESEYVRQRIADYLTDLFSIGLSGFRLDAAKHIKPVDIANILAKFKENIGGTFPEDFFTWLEILSGYEADVLFADDGEYSYAGGMDKTLRGLGFNDDDILKVKIWWSSYPANYNVDNGKVDARRKVIQNDDHDTQYADFRGLTESGKGCVLTEGCEPEKHREYEIALFKNPYGVADNTNDAPIRMILSSFYTRYNGKRLEGLPDGLSDCDKMCISDCDKCKEKDFPEFTGYIENGRAYSGSGYTRVHRDEKIIAAMQQWLGLESEVWEELPYPDVYNNFQCKKDEKDISSSYSGNLWNTPPRGSSRWKEGFQDMNVLVGYAQLRYSTGLQLCTVVVYTKTAFDLDLTYVFNGKEQSSNSKVFDRTFKDILKIVVKAKTGETLVLEDIDFVWNAEPLKTPKYDTRGQKGAIIEMYGWKDVDIAKECEFIGQQGYMGVKVFPHHEQVMSHTPFRNQMNPWYFMYQPVSYSLNGRLGTRDEFRQMINTCRSHGVRVYADAVINHMTYNGMDLQNHRFIDDTDKYLIGDKYSTNGSPYWTPYRTYEKNPYTQRGTNVLEYPAVPYGPMDFHCQKPIVDYANMNNVMYGWLDNLADLNTESVFVRRRIADYLTDLFSIGISGFRLDAAKHIKPADIASILATFKANIGGALPEDFFTWLEILSGYEADVLFAEDGENSYAGGMDKSLKKLGFTDNDLLKVKIWWSSYPADYFADKGNLDPRRKVIQNDDHDTQYADYRGLTESGKGCVLTEGCEPEKHREFEIALFKEPYDIINNSDDAPIRMILSSFYTRIGNNRMEGLPDGLSDCDKACSGDCDKCKENSLPEIKYDKNAKAYSGSGFTYVHRDEKIIEAMQYWLEFKDDWIELPEPEIYPNVWCKSKETKEMRSEFATQKWNTPPRRSDRWQDGFQDMNVLVGYAQLKYSPGQEYCTVTVITQTAEKLNLTYIFNDVEQTSNSKIFYKPYSGIVRISVKAKSGETLDLEDVDLVWNAEPLKTPKYDTHGQRGAIVEMYGWRDADIEQECEFLGKKGYMGVKVFPHHEQVMSHTPFRNQMNPWYFMYQPVSYSLNGRLGTRGEFRHMINTCRSHGVRVYADAVINHMSYNGMDLQKHRFSEEEDQQLNGDIYSTNNSPFWTPYGTYEKSPYTNRGTNCLEYPAVPYGPMDFHCQKAISDYKDFDVVTSGWLDELADLNTESDYVRQRIADYLTDLYSIGLSGFRLDAAKHIKPVDIANILAKFKENIGGTLPEDFFTWLEILSGDEADVLFAEDGEYSYAGGMDKTLKSLGFTDDDILKVKLWWSSYPKYYTIDNGKVDSRRKVIQNDDHDTQYADYRGLTDSGRGCVLTEGCTPDEHRKFEVKLFEEPYDIDDNTKEAPIRMLLSSFYTRIGDKRMEGLPDGQSDCTSVCVSDCEKCTENSLPEYIYDPNGKAYSGSGYTYVHRDEAIIKAMQDWVGSQTEYWEPLPSPNVYQNFICKKDEIDISSSYASNLWNTPPKGTARWEVTYQDMSVLVGYAQLRYSIGQQFCTVVIFTKTAIELDLTYFFNGEEQKSNSKVFDRNFKEVLKIVVKAKTGESLELEDVDFVWNTAPLKTPKYDTRGQKGAIVEMYGWKDADIEKECEFIGAQGYLGVKVFPHHEQVMSYSPFRNVMNPWYFMYQPVSYSLNGRLGTRDDFRKMIKTCRSHGVRVYADAVINHMTYNGFDMQNHRFTDEDKYLIGEKYATSGSPYWTPYKTFEKNPFTKRGTNVLEYPRVPYGPMDFHCQKPIVDYTIYNNVCYGWLDGLADLKTESVYVRRRIADYLTDLYSIGVSGFKLDAARHVKPTDIAHILAIFKANIGGTFPEDFFTWLEILSGNEAETYFAEDGEDSYAGGMDKTLKGLGFTDDDILKVKIWWSAYPGNYYIDNGTVDPRRKVIQNDDQDTQYDDFRGLTESGKGCVLADGCDADTHRNFEIKLFESPYGVMNNFVDAPIRMILSSFYIRNNDTRLEGLPDGLSDCMQNCDTNCQDCLNNTMPEMQGYMENGEAYSGSGFTRVHRDKQIIEAMQKWMEKKDEWEELPEGEVYPNVFCKSREAKDMRTEFEGNLWNTPPRGSSRWKPGFQDMNVLVGYAQLKYTQGQQQCTVIVYTKRAQDLELTYFFNDEEQESNVKVFDSTFRGILKIVVKAKSGEKLELEDVDFVWNVQPLKKPKYDTEGKRGAIVEMYGWRDADIEQECKFLGEQGYMGVKVFPHHEQVMSYTPFRNQMNPWYFMYQPVSYALNGRMGTRDEFRKMINTCRANGVRVYADAVINHMTYNGMDLQNHRFTDEADQYLIAYKYSTAHSPFWTPYRTYEKSPYTNRGTNCLEYPAVPYGPMDFHCQKAIDDYKDFDSVTYGWLDGLADLNTESDYVRHRIADYLTDLFSIGLSGFRLSNAKHIKPTDIANILAIFKSNIGGSFPDDFFTWLEVLSGDEADVLFAEDGENSYAGGMDKTLKSLGFTNDDLLKVKLWWSSYPFNYNVDKGLVDPRRKVIQNDDHDTQYADYRRLIESGKGCVLTEGCEPNIHRNYEVKLFESPYDVADNVHDAPIRMILSSFYTRINGVKLEGLPDGLSDCKVSCKYDCDKCMEHSLYEYPGYIEDGKAYSGEGFTRVHRDPAIIQAMQSWMELKEESWEALKYPEVYENVVCKSKQTKDMRTEFEGNLWNTPPRESARWKEGFQDMNALVGYAQLKYNSDRTRCTVTVFTKTAISLELKYVFDGEEQMINHKEFDTSFKNVLKIVVKARTGEILELEDVDFIWNSEPLRPGRYETNGQRGAIIEMFGWKDTDIEKECEFIGQQGYLGVKVFPHHEQVMSHTPFRNVMNPWYFMYQPVSYSLNGRLGTRDEFRKMIKTCRANGVRVYADAVINHMTYNGMDLQNHRFIDEADQYLIGDKYSTNNSPFWTPYRTYEKNPYTNRGTNCLEYPAVPYGPMDFHCQKAIDNYKDFDNVMYGWLDNLADLNTESDYVRQRIADYLTDLFSIGLSGFRLDAAKHIKPKDIANILAIFKSNIGGTLPDDFFTWLEILSGDEADILFAEDGENSYAGGMDKTLKSLGFTDEDLLKVKLWWSSYPKNYNVDNGLVDPRRKIIQNDDHDTQYADYRGLVESGNGCILTEGCEPEKHREFEVRLFVNPFDVADNFKDAPIRLVLSSFYTRYEGIRVEGLPDGLSECSTSCKHDCDKCTNNTITQFPGYIEDGEAYSGSGFTRVHRDKQIIEAMQKWMELTKSEEKWEELTYPEVYDNVQCESREMFEMKKEFENNLWNTPPRESKRWQEGFQDMNVLVGYPQLKYNSDRSKCTVTVYVKTAKDLELTYYFNDEEQTTNVKVFDATFRGILKIVVKAKTGEKLELEDVDFIWNSVALKTPKYDTKGQKGAIIEMFGWKDTDIEKECEFIGQQGYLGVKVFPHHEQVLMSSPFKNQMNPWYFMYQPVSYSLNGRMGTRDEFRQMIKTCRSHGVRVYADAVINHMTYNGMDLQNHRFTDEEDQNLIGEKYSTNGSPFWTPYRTYEKNPYTNRGTNCLEYPAVPYGPMDFHCQKPIKDYKDFAGVTTGWLDNLADLNTGSSYVQQRIADYLTDLFSIGLSGFRLDAAKHIKPEDIAYILAIFKENIGGTFPEDFFTWLEILSGDEADVLFAEEGEYSYAGNLDFLLLDLGFDDNDLLKIKIWWSAYPVNYNIDNGNVDRRRKVIQNDDHDTQYADFRGLTESGRGCVLTEGCDPEKHREFEIKLFEAPYDVPDNANDAPIRMILSSFYTIYEGRRLEGLPDGLSECSTSTTCKANCDKCQNYSLPEFPGYIENGEAYSGSGFTRVHRDKQIIAAMQKWMES